MLQGKVAVVVGGGSGIGAETSRLLAKNGAHVIVASEQPLGRMEEVCEEIRQAGGSAAAASCDICDIASIEALIAQVEADHGRLDVLVNSAGVFFRAPLVEMSHDQIAKMFAVNAIGAIHLVRAALPLMREGGGGSIVNISSAAAMLGVEGCAVYAATKAALAHFTRTLAPELRRSGVRVNSVGPGPVRTPMLGFSGDALTAEQVQSLAKREAETNSPYGNAMMDPSDIAEVVLFLASDASRGLQGSLVVADQGVSATIPVPG